MRPEDKGKHGARVKNSRRAQLSTNQKRITRDSLSYNRIEKRDRIGGRGGGEKKRDHQKYKNILGE